MNRYSIDQAKKLDQEDPLKEYREKFNHGSENLIYMDGNSLGKMPLGARERIQHTLEYQWGERLIRSWNEDWYLKNRHIGNKIAGIAGASEGEVIISDSTSVNLYKLASAALGKQDGRCRIVTDDLNFPSDIYVLQGLVDQMGPSFHLEIVRSKDGITMDLDQLERALDETTALVSLSHVAFKSSFLYPMKRVTDMVKKNGSMMLWDLSHSIGAVPVELNESGADLAVGCTYKYLNGGPGSPAFLYVRKDLQEELKSPVWGWFGQDNPFDFKLQYSPAPGIDRFLAGTPPVLSMVPVEDTLDMMNETGMKRIREKSVKQSEYLLSLVTEFLLPQGFSYGSPSDSNFRGSHVTIRHPEAYRICKALIDPVISDHIVIPDFREPDNIRLGIAPLYISFEDIYHTVRQIREIVEGKCYEDYSKGKETVT